MAVDTKILALFRLLIESYDSTIDTADNSTFYNNVIFPLLTRVGGDILETDTESFLADFVSERYPNLDTSEFSGIRDLVIRPTATMLEPIKREINSIRIAQSFANASSMTGDELNALLSNFFLEKVTGGFATGTVRVFFTTPTDVNTSGASFFTADGLEYIPDTNVIISASQMSFNVSGSLFYLDVVARSALAGLSYNIPIGTITEVESIIGADSVTNITAFSGGSNPESNAEAINRAKQSITVQNLVTKDGISFVLKSNFSGISEIKTIGFGDSEMIRDIVDGPSTISGVPGGSFNHFSNSIPASGIHIGGKTDVYVFDGSTTGQVAKSLSVSNLTDIGILLMSGQNGYVTSISGPQKFYDKTGYFDLRNVSVGDVLYIGASSFQITAVATDNLTLGSTLSAIQSAIKYEIRRVSNDNMIRIPLHNLSALNSDGSTAVSASSATTPAQPIPGDALLSPLQNSSGNVAKTENVVQITDSSSAGNLIRPLFRVTGVQLGAGSGAYSDLGKIAFGEVLEVTAPSGFTGADGSSGIAKGKLRVYARDKVNILAIPTIQATTDGSSGDYNALAIERNGNHKDTKTNRKYTGPIYSNGIYKYGIQSVQKDSSQTNPWTWSYAYSGVLNTSPAADTGSTGIANGNHFYIDRSPTYAVNPAPGMWVWNTGSASNRKFQLMQIISVRNVTGTKSNGYTGSAIYYECRVRAEDNTVPEFTGTGSDTFHLYQGVLAENLTYDSTYNIYYADFDAYCLNSNATASNISSDSEISLVRHVSTFNSSGSDIYIPFNDGLGGDNNDFYLEGYKVRSLTRGHAFSTREEPYLLLTSFVTLISSTNVATSSTSDLSDTSVSFSMRLAYTNGATASNVQTFVEQDANRIVAEDILIKPFLPAIPYGTITGKGITAVQGNKLIKQYLTSLNSTETLELSDLINYLYDNNVNYIALPMNLYVISYSQERRVSGERVTTKSTLSNIERFFTVITNSGNQSINFAVEV